jgi:hypothetical protein
VGGCQELPATVWEIAAEPVWVLITALLGHLCLLTELAMKAGEQLGPRIRAHSFPGSMSSWEAVHGALLGGGGSGGMVWLLDHGTGPLGGPQAPPWVLWPMKACGLETHVPAPPL